MMFPKTIQEYFFCIPSKLKCDCSVRVVDRFIKSCKLTQNRFYLPKYTYTVSINTRNSSGFALLH